MTDPDPRLAQLAQLEQEYAELVASLPQHSVQAAHLLRIEELEDEIAALRAQLADEHDEANPPGPRNAR